jgi:7-keto-8-aminopelargonate synthetase-like enzyme
LYDARTIIYGPHPKVIEAMCAASRSMSVSAGGTRNISGTNRALVELEAELADLYGKEAALAFTSGYVSNHTGIATIARLLPDCLILSDALDHNVMIEGMRAAGCQADLASQRSLAPGAASVARGARPPEADRVRERLFDGRRRRSTGGDLRPCGAF